MLNHILAFIEGRYIYCPRCLTRLPLRSRITQDITCEECQFLIPFGYISLSHSAPPVFVQLVGLTASGKTTFLDMLRLHLYDMDQVWGSSGFYIEPITQLDLDHKTTLLTKRVQGIMPASTPTRDRDQNEVYIMSLMNMPRWQSRLLVLMDHSGEQFDTLNIDINEIPFLQRTRVAILLLSLPDLANEGKRVDDLVTSYITSLENQGINFAKEHRQLVIVFSKADRLSQLPASLNHYLSGDTLYAALKMPQRRMTLTDQDMDSYIHAMETTDREIRAWVKNEIRGGQALLHILEDKGIQARFTLMTSTAQAIPSTPRRVLDPFFWVLEYYRYLNLQNTVPIHLNTIAQTFSPALHNIRSLIFLLVLFFGTIGGSIYLSTLSQNSPSFVGFCLLLVLYFICALVDQWIQKPHPITRNVLNSSKFAFLLASLIEEASPSTQQVLAHLTLYHVMSLFIVGSALFACLQPHPRLITQQRITLATIAGGGAFLQTIYGKQELATLPFIHSSIQQNTALYLLPAYGLIGCTLLLLFLTVESNWLDIATFLFITILYGGLQYAYGAEILFTLFPHSTNLTQINTIIVTILILILPLSFLILYRFIRARQLPIFILAIISAIMLTVQGHLLFIAANSVVLFSLTSNIMDFFVPQYFIEHILTAMCVLICIRWILPRIRSAFTILDQGMLLLTALIDAQIQWYPWRDPIPYFSIATFSFDLFTITRTLATILQALTIIESIAISASLFLPLTLSFQSIENTIASISAHSSKFSAFTLGVAHILIACTTLLCSLQILLYGQLMSNSAILFGTGKSAFTLYHLLALFFASLAFISLCRIAHPLTRADRLLLLLNILFCWLFYKSLTNPLIPLSFSLQDWNSLLSQNLNTTLPFALLLSIVACISFWWSTRCKFSGDRRLLQIIFGISLLCELLQLTTSLSLVYTVLALLALVMGISIAALVLHKYEV